MPSVIDAPEIVEHEEHAVYEEHATYEAQPPVREAHPGFWRTVVQYMRRQSVQTSTGIPSSSHETPHPIETPAELLARVYPTLYIRAFGGI